MYEIKRDKIFKTFCDSDLEMFEQLDLTEERIQRGEAKFYSLEEFFIKSQKTSHNIQNIMSK